MIILLCIDDTDNLESIGTGEVLENLCEELVKNNLGSGRFVTRHQLYIHEDIAYGISPDTAPTDNFSDAGNMCYTNFIA